MSILAQQEIVEKEKAAVEALRPVTSELRTLAADLKRRAEFESTIAELTAQHGAKLREEQACTDALTDLAFDATAFSAAGRAEAEARKVQARFTELGQKIGQAVSLKQQFAASRNDWHNGMPM